MGILSDVTIPLDELIEPTEGLGYQLIEPTLRELFYDVAEAGFELTLKAMATKIMNRE